MRDFPTFRKTAVRYWEKRRVIYNLALVLPAFFGYFTATLLPGAVGDPSYIGPVVLLLLFVLAAIGANICYSFCYTLEFVLGTDDTDAVWLRYGRRTILIAGIILGVVLAFLGGRNIGILEYQFRPGPVNHVASPDGAFSEMSVFVSHRPSTDRATRQKQLSKLYKRDDTIFDALDSRYYESQEVVTVFASRFVLENPEVFR